MSRRVAQLQHRSQTWLTNAQCDVSCDGQLLASGPVAWREVVNNALIYSTRRATIPLPGPRNGFRNTLPMGCTQSAQSNGNCRRVGGREVGVTSPGRAVEMFIRYLFTVRIAAQVQTAHRRLGSPVKLSHETCSWLSSMSAKKESS